MSNWNNKLKPLTEKTIYLIVYRTRKDDMIGFSFVNLEEHDGLLYFQFPGRVTNIQGFRNKSGELNRIPANHESIIDWAMPQGKKLMELLNEIVEIMESQKQQVQE